MRSMTKIKTGLAACLMLLMLVGCGGGGGSDAGALVLPGTGVAGGTGGTPSVNVALAVRLLDANGAATNAIVAGQPVRAQAVLTKNGVAVTGEIVQFAVDTANLVKIDPVSGSQLSDASGLSAVTVSSLGAGAGAGRITATATVGGVVANGAANFFASGTVGSQPATLTLGPVEIGKLKPPAVASVSAYGTTSVEVEVQQNGLAYKSSQVTVNFTSSCAAGKASLTPSANTQLTNGIAVATFVDNGCAQTSDSTVTITASIGTDTKSTSMTVRAPTAGSLRFLSVVPSDKSITLRGQGGNGRQENATATFKLVDVAGNGVGDADVCFDVTTYAGGLNLDGFSSANKPAAQGSNLLCGVDVLSVVKYVKRTNADGTVSVQINAGTVPTPIRVRARALYPATATAPLETFSDTLSISTGLPLQRSFSLSVDQANIDGGNFDGEIAKLTVRLADQFSNPVPDGTVVNFIASGAAVCTADNGSCKTLNGACSCSVVSQARRPQDNRVVVTAYAVGLEDYDDSDGNNEYTKGIDPFTDLADAYVDANKDGVPNSSTINGDTDVLVPYQKPTVYSPTGDSVRGTAHIRASTVIYLSKASTAGDPTVILPIDQLSQERDLIAGTISSPFLRLTPSCPDGVPIPQATLSMVLEDGIGNPMAALTTLAVADSSDSIAPAGFRPSVVLAFGARPPSPLTDLPNIRKLQRDPSGLADPYLLAASNSPSVGLARNGTVSTGHSVTVRGVKDKCSGNASFAMEVASPRGGKASTRILYDGESRSRNRFAFDIRYRNPIDFAVKSDEVKSLTMVISRASWVGDAIKYTVDWGDGSFSAGAGAEVPSTLEHHYEEIGTYFISMRFERGGSYEVREPKVVKVLSRLSSQKVTIGFNPPSPTPRTYDFDPLPLPKYEIDWGEGKPLKSGDILMGQIPLADLNNNFTTAGPKTVSLRIITVTGADTKNYGGSQVITVK